MINQRVRALSLPALAVVLLALAGCERDRTDVSELGLAAELQAEVDRLDERSRRLRDAADIRRLQRAYGHYVDRAHWDQVADLFAEDARIEFGDEGAYIGRERIREYYMRQGGGETGLRHGQINTHMQLQPVVHVSDDGLTGYGRWRAFSMVGQFGEKALWAEGPYENEYVKRDGVWQIASLRWYPTFVVPYEDGWAHAEPKDGWRSPAVEDFPPDREPSEHRALFPNVYVAPFHYERPVAGHEPTDSQAPEVAPGDADVNDTPALAELREAIERRRVQLRRLEAYQAVENLQAKYGYYVDRNLWSEAADLFSDDAEFEYGQRGVYRGQGRIRDALQVLFGPEGPQHGRLNTHMQLQPLVTVSEDGRSARARWRGLDQLGVHGEDGEWRDGVYENEYVYENGAWRIRRLHYYLTLIAGYEEGWVGDGLRPMEGPSGTLPPDDPPTEVYESLPGVHVPPFHYDHPVSGEPVTWPPQR